MNISAQALIATIKVNCLRRPLWQLHTVCDCLDLSREEVMARVQDGTLPYAFDLGTGKNRKLLRILALSVVEQLMGPLPAVGATKNLDLPQVINLILPARDVRSTELKRIFSCGNDWFHDVAANFKTVKPAASPRGPNGYRVVSRASVADFLAKRRIT